MLHRFQSILAHALLDDNPHAKLHRLLAENDDLDAEHRAMLERLDPEGLKLSSVMFQKIRFEQLLRGHRGLRELFSTDPRAFMELYRAYAAEVPSCCYLTDEEGQCFDDWLQSTTNPVAVPYRDQSESEEAPQGGSNPGTQG
jgi:uncharacterized protein YeaO (DUF488 family)